MIYIGKTSLQKIFEKLLGYFAPLDSPKLTGTPTAPTPAADVADDSQQIANVAFVKANTGKVDTSKFVTTDGVETITAEKVFTKNLNMVAGGAGISWFHNGNTGNRVGYLDGTTYSGRAAQATADAKGNQIDTTYATMDWVKKYVSEHTGGNTKKSAITIKGVVQAGDLFAIANPSVEGTFDDGSTFTASGTLTVYPAGNGYISPLDFSVNQTSGRAVIVKFGLTQNPDYSDVTEITTVMGKISMNMPQERNIVFDAGQLAKIQESVLVSDEAVGAYIVMNITEA